MEGERDRNINVWFPLTHPLLGTRPATQACALTGNRTCDPLVHRSVPNPLSHTSQGPLYKTILKNTHFSIKMIFILIYIQFCPRAML